MCMCEDLSSTPSTGGKKKHVSWMKHGVELSTQQPINRISWVPTAHLAQFISSEDTKIETLSAKA